MYKPRVSDDQEVFVKVFRDTTITILWEVENEKIDHAIKPDKSEDASHASA